MLKKMLNDYYVNLDYKFVQQELETIQNNLNDRLNNFKVEVNDLMCSNKCHLSHTFGSVKNISIFADYRKPPVSVILLLKLSKTPGNKVACISYCKNNEPSNVSEIISKYLKANLDIDQSRQLYDYCFDNMARIRFE